MAKTKRSPKRRVITYRIRNYFFAGVLVSAPVIVTGWLVVNVIGFFDRFVRNWIPKSWLLDTYLPFAFPGLGLIVVFLALVIIGFLTANLVGRMTIGFFERILARVPVISNIYKTVKQIFDTVLASRSSSFRKVVLIEYPRKGVWAIAFLAGETAAIVKEGMNEDVVSVFLPTTPNPTSGFFLLIPRNDVRELDMTIEEGVKMVVSSGIVVPENEEGDK
ncbi:MAG: DUF502 domain-containing protein [Alphaproteobacteria bacterium]